MVDIDPRDHEVAVESAGATLNQACAVLQSARQDYQVAKANVTQAEATNLKAQRDVQLYELLMRYNVVARERYEEELRIGEVDQAP